MMPPSSVDALSVLTNVSLALLHVQAALALAATTTFLDIFFKICHIFVFWTKCNRWNLRSDLLNGNLFTH